MKGTVPSWVQRLLGVDELGVGEGTVWSLQHRWPWAPWVTLIFIAAAAGYLGWIYARDTRGLGRIYGACLYVLRSTSVGLVLLMLAELAMARQRTGLPYVVVMLDDSASMGIIDRYGNEPQKSRLSALLSAGGFQGLSRFNLARALLLENQSRLLKELDSRYRLKVYLVGNSTRQQTGTADQIADGLRGRAADGESSRLGDGVRAVLDDLRGTPLAAVILISDGVTTDGETLSQAAEEASARHVPLMTIGVGSRDPTRNIKLHELLVDDHVFVNDIVNFEVQLTATGLENKKIVVVLKEPSGEQELARVETAAGRDGEPKRVTIPYRPTREGTFRYLVEALPHADEEQRDDNRQERTVEVHKGKIKVLLVQSTPSYEFRRLKEMLARDDTIQLKTLLQEADLEYTSADRTALRVFPVRREPLSEEDDQALFHYDVVLFGDVNPSLLGAAAMTNLADFVAQLGRGMVVIAGPRYTPLGYAGTPMESLFPVELDKFSPPDDSLAQEPFVMRPTALGMASPPFQLGDHRLESEQIWREFPPLYWMVDVDRLKPGARVLAEHPARVGQEGKKLPLIVSQFVNRGRVIFHATDETWRWRFRVGDPLFARYWVQTIRFLSRSKLQNDASAELTADRREYRRGEPVRLRLQFFDERSAPAADDGAAVVVEAAGQKKQQLVMRRSVGARGVFEGLLPHPADGDYHAFVVTPSLPGGPPQIDFSVVAPPGELRKVHLDVAELRGAAKKSRGRYYPIDEVQTLLNELPEGREIAIESLEPWVLWNRWPVLGLFTLVLLSEWLLRKYRGLL